MIIWYRYKELNLLPSSARWIYNYLNIGDGRINETKESIKEYQNKNNWDGSTPVQDGDNVWVSYIWTLQWTYDVFDTNIQKVARACWVFDNRRPYESFTFTIGNWEMIPWFENAVANMKVWETKTVDIPTEQAYGEPSEENYQDVPKSQLPQKQDGTAYKKWDTVMTRRWPVEILSTDNENITLDLNSPLAWEDLTFTITVESVN